RTTGASLPTSFHILSALSLTLYFVVVLVYLASRTDGAFALVLMPLLLSPQFISAFQEIYYPTLFLSALLAAFFFILRFNLWASLLPLALSCFTRESAIVLVAVIAASAIITARRTFAVAAAAVGLASLELASL